MYVLVIERFIELVLQNVIYALDDEANDLNGSIYDTELCNLFRQSVLEKLLIKLYL